MEKPRVEKLIEGLTELMLENFEKVDERFDKVDERFDRLENRMDRMEGDMKVVRTTLDEHTRILDNHSAILSRVEGDVEMLIKDDSRHDRTIKKLQKVVKLA